MYFTAVVTPRPLTSSPPPPPPHTHTPFPKELLILMRMKMKLTYLGWLRENWMARVISLTQLSQFSPRTVELNSVSSGRSLARVVSKTQTCPATETSFSCRKYSESQHCVRKYIKKFCPHDSPEAENVRRLYKESFNPHCKGNRDTRRKRKGRKKGKKHSLEQVPRPSTSFMRTLLYT